MAEKAETGRYTRPEVARLLGMEDWLLANLASKDYPYGLPPTARRAKGRGKAPGLYSVADIYKIAVAHRMVVLGFQGEIVGHVIRELFPKEKDPIQLCVAERPEHVGDMRFLVVNFVLAPWVRKSRLPEEWRVKASDELQWLMLKKWTELPELWSLPEVRGKYQVGAVTLSIPTKEGAIFFGAHQVRTAFIMPFDELMAEVDARLSSFGSETGPPIPKMREQSDEEIAEVDDQIRRENE